VAGLDVAKGAAAALIGTALAGEVGGIVGGVAALVGHWRPLFLRFARGGKIVATTAGVTLALAPLAALAACGVWVVVFLVGRYSSLASLAGAISLPFLAYAFGASWPIVGFTIGASAAIIVLRSPAEARSRRGNRHRRLSVAYSNGSERDATKTARAPRPPGSAARRRVRALRAPLSGRHGRRGRRRRRGGRRLRRGRLARPQLVGVRRDRGGDRASPVTPRLAFASTPRSRRPRRAPQPSSG
jgi:hypothetical protein